MRLTTNDVAEHYTYFYSQKYKSPDYELKYSDKSLKVSEKFLSLFIDLMPHADTTNLWNYCMWQFDRWEDVDFKNQYSDRIQFDWIFGVKAFDLFCTRDKKMDWIFKDSKKLKKYNFNRDHIRQKALLRVSEGFDYEEVLKQSYLNTETGLADCIDNDIFWKPDSNICAQCKYIKQCITILKDNYPKIYSLRKKK